ncbi:MAG TPA: PQQ-dependent sugar dehydrogenase, partial [Acidimicrobiales bacterium]|nr:PQQ-dependent sugar dehydrogenase [Acidimicrobiales bacterium]
GGAIHFGPDGKLYAAVGENANGANAQSMSNLLGKILRINADGSIPADNPFFSTATGVNRAIWALGLRNPFTFAFQPGTGRMFINDVGQSTWEEIDEGTAGANYGWPTTEGPTTDPRFVSPLFSYGHGAGATVGCAITGGAFYNPSTSMFPPENVGQYFFADFCSGWIRRLDPTTRAAVGFASAISSPVDMRVTADGAVYYLARGSGTTTGQVWRVSFGETSGVRHPGGTTISAGTLRAGDAAGLASDDDSYFEVTSTAAGKTSWYGRMPAVPNDLTSLTVTFSGKNSSPCTQTVSVYRWVAATWETLDTRTVGPTEVRVAGLSPAGPPSEYVSGDAGTGKVRVRVRCTGATTTSIASGDLMEIAFTR